jgi:hypothetical protein
MDCSWDRIGLWTREVVVLATIGLVGATGCSPLPADGAATTPASYRFVDPPALFAAGNVSPQDRTATIALGAGGSAPAGIATPDGQFVIDLGRGAIAPAASATTVAVRITALAPRHLRALPNGRSNGNAYRVDMMYQPTGVNVARFAKPGTLLIETPELASALYDSPDATHWSALASRPSAPRELRLRAQFPAPGYYLAGTLLPELAAPVAPHTHHSRLVFDLVVIVLAVGVVAGAGVVVLRRRS